MAAFVLVKLLGVAMVAVGVMFLVIPEAIKKYVAFWTKGKRVYTGGALSVLIGVILLLVASQCRIAWLIALFGIMAIIKGIVLFVLGPKKFAAKINLLLSKPANSLRLMAVFGLGFGVLLICSA